MYGCAQTAKDSPVPQYLPILEEYKRAWEDETYTMEEWQNVDGVFMTLTDAKFRHGMYKDYTLYYSMSDLIGDGIEELMIGIDRLLLLY